MKRFVAFAMLLLVLGGSESSTAGPGDLTPVYRHFDDEQGIGTGEVVGIVQTSDGSLWVASQGGVSFLDGDRFTPVGTEVFAGERITKMLAAGERTVLIATQSSGVWRVGPTGEAVRLAHPPTASLLDMHMVGDSVILLSRNGLWVLDRESGTTVEHPFGYTIKPSAQARRSGPDVGNGAIKVVHQSADTYWILDPRLGPGSFHPGSSPTFAGPISTEWRDLIQTSDGRIYALNRELGLFEVKPETGAVNLVNPLARATSLSGNHACVVISMADGRVIEWSADGQSCGTSLPDRAISDGLSVRVVYRDTEGGIWLGTKEGLYHVPTARIRHMRTVGGRPIVNARAFTAGAPSSPWLSSYGSGLLNLAEGTSEPVDGMWYVAEMMRSHDGYDHVLTEAGRFSNREGAWRRVGDDHGAVRGSVDARGRAVLWTDRGIVLESEGEVGNVVYEWPIDERDHFAFTLDASDRLVLRANDRILRGTIGDAGAIDFETIAVVPELAGKRSRHILVDHLDRVWLPSGADGLLVVDQGRVERLLEGHRVTALNAPEPGLFVASTQSGVFGFDDALASRFHFGRVDGLLSGVANGVLIRNEHLIVAHPTGFSFIPTKALDRVVQPPDVILDAVRLSEKQGTLEMRLRSTSLNAGSRVRYEYRLNGGAWQETPATWLVLVGQSGSNTVDVRARVDNGASGAPQSYVFVVPAHWSRHPWFLVLSILVIVAAGWSAHRVRMHAAARREAYLREIVDERTRELSDSHERLEEQAQRLLELDEVRSRFFADISHELKTPLTVIRASLGDLSSPSSQTSVEELLHHPLGSVDRMSTLIDEILELSRLRSGKVELNRSVVDVAALLRHRVGSLLPVVRDRKLILTTSIPARPLWAKIDSEAITRVFDNLLSNAIKFSPGGGTVFIEMIEREGAVIARFTDAGPGIPEESVPHIFDRYYRGTDASPDAATGTGIGLSLSLELVRLHDGKIDVSSSENSGTTFSVLIPDAVVASAVSEHSLPQHGGDGASVWITIEEPSVGLSEQGRADVEQPDDEKPVILLVEDNDHVRAHLADRVGRDFRVLQARDGVAALELLKTYSPDLLVSDIAMPGMDGLELCRMLRANQENARTPILLLTARSGPRDAIEALDAGADDYLTKPFDTGELLARIRRHLARRDEMSEPLARCVVIGPEEIEIASADEAFVERFRMLLEERHPEASLTVEEMAGELGVSPRQLRRRCTDLFNVPPLQYLRTFRLERAAQMISAEAGSISEIAFRVGFNDMRVFRKHFKNHFGINPSAFLQSADVVP